MLLLLPLPLSGKGLNEYTNTAQLPPQTSVLSPSHAMLQFESGSVFDGSCKAVPQ